MLSGQVTLGVSPARPAAPSRLRSTRRSNRLPTVLERARAAADSDAEDDAEPSADLSRAPRITRRGVPRRPSREGGIPSGLPRDPPPGIAKKQLSPSSLRPLALVRSGASDLLGDLELCSEHKSTASQATPSTCGPLSPAAMADASLDVLAPRAEPHTDGAANPPAAACDKVRKPLVEDDPA